MDAMKAHYFHTDAAAAALACVHCRHDDDESTTPDSAVTLTAVRLRTINLPYAVAQHEAINCSNGLRKSDPVRLTRGGSVAEWLACWTQAQKGPGSNRSRDAVG